VAQAGLLLVCAAAPPHLRLHGADFFYTLNFFGKKYRKALISAVRSQQGRGQGEGDGLTVCCDKTGAVYFAQRAW
jgi:hypothetical protein